LYDRLSDTLRLAVRGSDGSRVQVDYPDLSNDGQRLFFTSIEGTLVANDTNGVQDLFELDISTGTVQRLSLNSYDEEGSLESYLSDSSGDGHFVVWSSQSPEFVVGDTNGVGDVFLRERSDTPFPTRTPTATMTPTATATPRIPPYPNEQFLPLTVREKKLTNTPFLANITAHGNGGSSFPVTSRNGGVVAFISAADNLVPNDTNGQPDIFVWERATQQITRVSVSSTGAQLAGRSERPAISEDGRYIVYTAWADGVVPEDTNGKADIYRYDRVTGMVLLISVAIEGGGGDGDSVHADVSGDGNVVVFTSNARNLNAGGTPGVPGGKFMGFVRNLTTNTTTLLRYNGTGNIFQEAAWPSISDDGTKVGLAVWYTYGYCAGQPIARIDVATGATETIASTTVNHHWELLPNAPRISPDGTQVGYRYYANGTANSGYFLLVGGANGYALTTLPVPGEACGYFSGNSQEMAFSANGQRVAFTSADVPAIPGDTNTVNDVFVWNTTTQHATWVSRTATDPGNGNSYDAYISGDGRTVYFASDATNLVSGDTNGMTDLFVWIGE
jgi:Tol biopolymer transport system component